MRWWFGLIDETEMVKGTAWVGRSFFLPDLLTSNCGLHICGSLLNCHPITFVHRGNSKRQKTSPDRRGVSKRGNIPSCNSLRQSHHPKLPRKILGKRLHYVSGTAYLPGLTLYRFPLYTGKSPESSGDYLERRNPRPVYPYHGSKLARRAERQSAPSLLPQLPPRITRYKPVGDSHALPSVGAPV